MAKVDSSPEMKLECCQQKEDNEFRGHLAALREKGTLCDAYITIPGENARLPVHRVVLASCSDFFRSLFTSGLRETVQADVNLHGVSLKTMELIIHYAYTKQARLTSENVEEVFAAADRFSILCLLADCVSFLISQLCPDNCIGILRFAKFYNSTSLKSRSWAYMLRHFQRVSKCQEFVQLQAEELIEIVADDNLKVSDEDDVLAAIFSWVDYCLAERKKFYSALLEVTRLGFVSEKCFISQLLDSNRFKKHSQCWELIERANRFMHYFRATGMSTLQCFKGVKFLTPRIPNSIIFIIGGWGSTGVTSSVETYDRITNQWFEISECELPTPRAYHATVRLDDAVFVIGGFDGGHYLNSVACLDVTAQRWEERAPMYMSRCYVSAAVIGSILYACGGFDGRQRHRSAEKYDRQKNQWTLITPMHYLRSDAGAASHDGKLYIAGGFDGDSCLFSAEEYDPTTDQWTMLPSLTTRRSGVSMVNCCDRLYAIGGYDGITRLRTVEYYDPDRRAWFTAPSMNLGRSNFSAVVMDGTVYVMGGYDGDKTSSEAEKYVPGEKRWAIVQDLNIGRSAVSACTMIDVSNSRDFTFHGNQSNNETNCGGDASLQSDIECWNLRLRKRETAGNASNNKVQGRRRQNRH